MKYGWIGGGSKTLTTTAKETPAATCSFRDFGRYFPFTSITGMIFDPQVLVVESHFFLKILPDTKLPLFPLGGWKFNPSFLHESNANSGNKNAEGRLRQVMKFQPNLPSVQTGLLVSGRLFTYILA